MRNMPRFARLPELLITAVGVTLSRFLERLSALSPALSRCVAYVTAIAFGGAYLVHLVRGSLAYLGLLEDDFFYYAIVADRLASLGHLTFDGITSTNGFHRAVVPRRVPAAAGDGRGRDAVLLRVVRAHQRAHRREL